MSLFPGDLDATSDELDSLGPFIGRPSDPKQEREWPRTRYSYEDAASRPGDPGYVPEDYRPVLDPEVVPDAVLDWVALYAYSLSIEHQPAIRSTSAGKVSVSYDQPKISQLDRRMSTLLAPYLARTGSLS